MIQKRYNWRDYWRAQEGMALLHLTQYSDIYPWWNRRRYRLGGKLWKMWYYFKCWAWNRYSTVTPRFVGPTWIDRNNLLLHTSFEILMDYVEKEHENSWTVESLEAELAKPVNPDDPHSREWCESYLSVATEIEFLYRWWTELRPAREAEYNRRLEAWDTLHSKQRADYTVAHPNWQETENPHLRLWSLPEDAPKPDGLDETWKALDELSDEARDAEDDEMLKRLIDVRGSLWT
jgi:hypothetical protein